MRDSHVNDYLVSLKCNSLQNAILTSLDKNDILSVTLNPFVYFAAPGNHMCDVMITDEDSENESVYQVLFYVDCDSQSLEESLNQMGLREYERAIPVPTISEISKQGTISISWNVEMEVPQNLTELFSTSPGRRLQEESALEISLIEGEETEYQALETENIFIKSFTAR